MENLITCKICGKQSTRIYGRHLNHHGLTSDEYLKLYPGEPLYSVSDNKKTTVNSGKHMKEEKYKKMFSEKISGQKNPNSKSKTTEEQRKQRSPFSKSFSKYENENECIEFSKKVHGMTKWQLEKYPDDYLMRLKMDASDIRDMEKDMTSTKPKPISKRNAEALAHYYDTETKKTNDEYQEWRKIALDRGEIDEDGNFLK